MFLELSLAMAATASTICLPAEEASDDYLQDVCDPLLEGSPAYSATYRVSLSPRPASQQVMVYQRDGSWHMSIAGYRWERGGAIDTRRHDVEISEADAKMIIDRITKPLMERLQSLPYYGISDVIVVCTDGANYTVEMAEDGQRYAASQHSCAEKTELNETMALFRSLALKYDPEFDGLLSGLKSE